MAKRHNDTVRIRPYVEVDGEIVDDVVEVSRAEWGALTVQQRQELAADILATHLKNWSHSGVEILGSDAASAGEL